MQETFSPIRVLVLDRVGYGTFERMLRFGGYTVLGAANPHRAWRELTDDCPDVLLLDLARITSDDMLFLRKVRSNQALAMLKIAVLSSDWLDQSTLAKDQRGLKPLRAQLWTKPMWTSDFLEMIDGLFS